MKMKLWLIAAVATLGIAVDAVMAHQHAREFSPGVIPLARSILQALDDRLLHHFIDPGGKQMMPEDRWMCDSLSSDSPLMALLAYWRAKAAGIQLDECN